ncbi:helix-turn-helix domain-containing protein [Paenibacillus albidus]|uniref:helix-turn-helix domain-containing protein n=1 Tax=Paenibacillus albidus TaxID=2041023 RepID=UPI001BE70B9C|nr:helix-turn-helix domain-containing protein [Paenibacillus albidus]MBT2291838.1 helix-turn-helix domain-containing protein [Paenibacillus albidus]
MDLDLLIHFCNLQSSTFLLPYSIYMNNELVSYSSSFLKNFDLLSPNLSIIQNSKSYVRYFVTEDFLVFGYIKSRNENLLTLIGPGAIGVLSEKDVDNIIFRYIKIISMEEKELLKNQLKEMPIISLERFLIALCSANCFINHQILTTQKLLTKGIEENVWLKTQLKLINIEQKEVYEETSEQSLINYEEQISFCIKNGMTDVLKEVLKNSRYNLGKLGPDALRHFKNATIILNSLSLRAAISGGLNADTCYKLGGLYIQQLESCQNIESLSRISTSMIIDYCTRVQNEQMLKTKDETINKCINYIFTNYHEKMTVQMIAKKIGISSEYLSSKFKKVTGINLPTFINQKKIQEAKKLLVFTNMPLSEVSEYLSFSNQSYFQTIFKIVTGMTPLQYRKESNLYSDKSLLLDDSISSD